MEGFRGGPLVLGGSSGAPVQVLLYYRSHADVAASQQGAIEKKKKQQVRT